MVQVPGAIIVAVVPLAVHTDGVVEAKLTASFELDVAFKVTVAPGVCAAMAAKVIV